MLHLWNLTVEAVYKWKADRGHKRLRTLLLPKTQQIVGHGNHCVRQVDEAEAANPRSFKPFYVKAEKLAGQG